VLLVVTLTELLDCYISQVNHHIVNLSHVCSVLLCAEPSKAPCVKVSFKRTIRCNENVHAQVKLLASYQERLLDIPTDNVVLLEVRLIKGLDLGIHGPLFELDQFVHEEDPLALSSGSWFHNPHGVGCTLELIDKHVVILWQLEG
jgi:hypothetical protein